MAAEKEYKTHSNSYNVIMGFILKASQLLFPLITVPYISRILQPEGIGRVSFAQSSMDIFTMFAMLGIPLYGIKACSRVRDDKVKLATTVKELLSINTIAMIISYIALFISIISLKEFNNDARLFLIVSMQIALTVFGVEWFYQAIEQYDYITIRSVLGKFVSLILMFVLVKDSSDVLQYGFIVVVGSVGSNIFNIIRLHKFISLRSSAKCNILQHIKPILILFAFSATTTIYNSLASVMIGFLSTNSEIGFYTTAVKIKNLLVGVITVVSSVLLPRATYLLKHDKKDEFLELIRNTFNFNLLISIPISAFCILEAKNIILIIAGEAFLSSVPVMQIIMPAVIFIGLTNVIGIQLFLPLNKEMYVFISTLVGAIVDIILNFVFIPKYGAFGAAIATMTAEFSVLVIQSFFLRTIKIQLFSISEFLKILNATIFSFLFDYKITMTLNSKLLEMLTHYFIFCFFFIMLCIIFQERFFKQFIITIAYKIKP